MGRDVWRGLSIIVVATPVQLSGLSVLSLKFVRWKISSEPPQCQDHTKQPIKRL
jgi:hypothetical protein